MKKVPSYLLAYLLWIIDIGIALWLFFNLRTLLLHIFTLFFDPTNLHNAQVMNVTDRAIVVLLGLGWLVFMIVVEEYFRLGASKGDVFRRIARVTGPLLLATFIVDLLLIWFTGTGGISTLRWLTLAVELGAGLGLLVLARTRLSPTSK